MARLTVKASGALLDGRAPTLVTRMVDELVDEVSSQAADDVRQVMTWSFRNPTGDTRSSVSVVSEGRDKVVESDVFYIPWLERGGWRGSSFKGYKMFAKAAREARKAIQVIGPTVAAKYLRLLNGG